MHPSLSSPRSGLFPGSIGMWRSPSPQSIAVGVSLSPMCLQSRKNNCTNPAASHPKTLHPPQKNKSNKRKIHLKIHLFQKKPNLSLSLSAKVPLVSKVQEVGRSTGCSLLGTPAFYPDPCWESRERSQISHSYCLGGSEAIGGAEAEREEHPWSDSPGSLKLCKACEGVLRGVAEILGVSRRDRGPTVAWLRGGGGKGHCQKGGGGLVGKTASIRLIPVPPEAWIPVRCFFLVVWP